jgi:uncharacterized protein
MKCPKCDITLNITDRQGIEIDYCPQCRGIWLDRGELDKIIERSADAHTAKHRDDDDDDRRRQYRDDYRRNDHDDDHRGYGKYNEGHRPHKKKSFLGELFDFD